MYYPTFTEYRRAHKGFHDSIENSRDNIELAVELLSTGFKGVTGLTSDRTLDIIERRKAILMTLSNMNLDLNHGDKMEEIEKQAGGIGLKSSEVERLRTALVRGGVIEKVALGYYRIDQKYWKNIPSKHGGIEYSESPDYRRMHDNIDEEKIAQDISRAVGKPQAERALTLVKLLSQLHKNRQHCARAIDIRDVMQMEDFIVSESQVIEDLTAMSHSISPQPTKEDSIAYPPLTEKISGEGGVYWQLQALIGEKALRFSLKAPPE
jgi:hypothetical protein